MVEHTHLILKCDNNVESKILRTHFVNQTGYTNLI